MRLPFRFGRGRAARTGGRSPAALDAALRAEVVEFLRDWLPPHAKDAYRALILGDPERWMEDPHFQGGIVVEHTLRGNGISERVLGVDDLHQYWPDLLREAVLGEELPRGTHAQPRRNAQG